MSKRIKYNKEFAQFFVNSGLDIWCELRFDGCTGDNFLHIAHSKKGRFLLTEDDFREVILACDSCHHKIEYLPPKSGKSGHERMRDTIRRTIELRNIKISKWIKIV